MNEQSSKLSQRFCEAFNWAFQLHGTQVRKGSSVPYISHLMAVTALVLEDGGTEDEAIAALLHDAVEDQGGQATLNQIHQKFGESVAAMVSALSETMEFPKPPWGDRKQKYLEQLQQASDEVLKIAIADKLHNTRSMIQGYRSEGEPFWERFNASRIEIMVFMKKFMELCESRQMISIHWQELTELEAQLEILSESLN